MARRKLRLTYAPKGLKLSDTQFDDLHQRLERTRKNSRTVIVERESLTAILADHALLYQRIEECDRYLRSAGVGEAVETRPVDGSPEPRRRRDPIVMEAEEPEEDLIG